MDLERLERVLARQYGCGCLAANASRQKIARRTRAAWIRGVLFGAALVVAVYWLV